MMRWRLSIAGAMMLLAIFHFGPAMAEPRIALVIANQAYSIPGGALANTYQDGELMKEALEKVGFKVTSVRDTPNDGRLLQVVGEHMKRLADAGPDSVGFIYYTGHGAADGPGGINYLLPTGMPTAEADDLKLYAVPLEKITELLSTTGKLNIVVFDACRNVPMKRSGKAFAFKGFAPYKYASGLLVAYATDPGNVAIDQSLYARALAEEMQRPGQDVSSAFRAAGKRVSDQTRGEQRPQLLDARTGDFMFVPAAAPPASLAATGTARPPDEPQRPPAQVTSKPETPKPRPPAGGTGHQDTGQTEPHIAALQSPPAADCVPEAQQVSTDAAGRASFSLTSSCGPVAEVMVRYQGIGQRQRVTGSRVVVDLFGGPGPVTFELPNGRSTSVAGQGPRGTDMIKVALVWSGAVNLDLHVLQDGARVGDSDALWAGNRRTLADAQTGRSGFISTVDDGASDGDHVEVYTFLKTINHRSGSIELRVAYASRGETASGDFCGSGPKARTDFKILRYEAGKLEQHARSFIPSVPCGTRLDERSRYQLIPKPIRLD